MSELADINATTGVLLARTKKLHRIGDLLKFGRLRFSRLSSYRDIQGSSIGDQNEGVGLHFSSDNPTLKTVVTVEGGGSFEMTSADFKKLIVEREERHHGVLCMTAFPVASDGFYQAGPLDEFIRDPRNREFGDTMAIFKNTRDFVERLKAAALAQGFELWSGLVTYLPAGHCGKVTPFNKIGDYAHQREWRFVTTTPLSDEHLDLELGNLVDLVTLIDLNQVPVTKRP